MVKTISQIRESLEQAIVDLGQFADADDGQPNNAMRSITELEWVLELLAGEA